MKVDGFIRIGRQKSADQAGNKISSESGKQADIKPAVPLSGLFQALDTAVEQLEGMLCVF